MQAEFKQALKVRYSERCGLRLSALALPLHLGHPKFQDNGVLDEDDPDGKEIKLYLTAYAMGCGTST